MSCGRRIGVAAPWFGLIVAVVLALGIASPAAAVLYVYEPFDYPAGQQLVGQNGGIGFLAPWRDQTDPSSATIQNGSINYPGVPTTGNSVLMTGESVALQVFRNHVNIPGTNGTTTWISFLGQRLGPENATANPYPRGVNVSFYSEAGFAVHGREQFAIGNSSGAATNDWAFIGHGQLPNLVPSTTPAVPFGGAPAAFFVLRIDHKGLANPSPESAADNDDIHFWVNPDPLVEPTLESANGKRLGTESNTFDYAGLDYVRPFVANSTGAGPYGELLWDELRMGSTYGDVTGVSPVLPGDTNENGIPGEYPDDFIPIRDNFRKFIDDRVMGDLVDDGVIDFKDYRQWKDAYVAGGGSLAAIDWGSTQIPEPAAGLLAVVAWGAIAGRAKSRGRREES